MKRTSLLVALVAVVGMLVVPAAGVVAQASDAGDEDHSADVSPGERLSGVVGVQNAEIDGEIERNAFRIALERADDNATKAGHIAEKLNETERRLAELDERKSQLQQQRERGEMTEGQYRARTAMLASETETAKEQLNRSNATAAGLPEETLRENGINTTAIRTLMHNADELSGGEVSEIARGIAGDRSGMVDRGPGDERGPAGERGPGAERGPGDRGGMDEADEPEDGQTGADNPEVGDDGETPDDADGSETDGGDADGSDSGADSDSTDTGSDPVDSDDTGSNGGSGSSGSSGSSGGSGSSGTGPN